MLVFDFDSTPNH